MSAEASLQASKQSGIGISTVSEGKRGNIAALDRVGVTRGRRNGAPSSRSPGRSTLPARKDAEAVSEKLASSLHEIIETGDLLVPEEAFGEQKSPAVESDDVKPVASIDISPNWSEKVNEKYKNVPDTPLNHNNKLGDHEEAEALHPVTGAEQDFLSDLLADLHAEAGANRKRTSETRTQHGVQEEQHQALNAWDFAALYGDATPDIVAAIISSSEGLVTSANVVRAETNSSTSGGNQVSVRVETEAPQDMSWLYDTQYLQISNDPYNSDFRGNMARRSSLSTGDEYSQFSTGDSPMEPEVDTTKWATNRSTKSLPFAEIHASGVHQLLLGEHIGSSKAHVVEPQGNEECSFPSKVWSRGAEAFCPFEDADEPPESHAPPKRRRRRRDQVGNDPESNRFSSLETKYDNAGRSDFTGSVEWRYIEALKRKLGLPKARLEQHPLLGHFQMQPVEAFHRESDNVNVSRDYIEGTGDDGAHLHDNASPLESFPSDNLPEPERLKGNGTSAQGVLPAMMRKRRLVWTPQLHERFVKAVNEIGVEQAMPKILVNLMNVEGLTPEHVKSHLQKYRRNLRRAQNEQADSKTDADSKLVDIKGQENITTGRETEAVAFPSKSPFGIEQAKNVVLAKPFEHIQAEPSENSLSVVKEEGIARGSDSALENHGATCLASVADTGACAQADADAAQILGVCDGTSSREPNDKNTSTKSSIRSGVHHSSDRKEPRTSTGNSRTESITGLIQRLMKMQDRMLRLLHEQIDVFRKMRSHLPEDKDLLEDRCSKLERAYLDLQSELGSEAAKLRES
ncbi:hypothetical protein CCYA_CCYA19G4712 [Cyanidiococcus yangmingshanensis]|nr:hypothetical protein CCYA_CCYA19G4712 [Cyanidiococcus yangmingshanensis]